MPATAQLRQARALSLDVSALDAALVPARRGAEVVLLPLPDGRSARFGVREASVMDAPTAARFPELRTYRLAVAATAEYTAEYTANRGGTLASAQAAIMTTVNHVTGVYERELTARLLLVRHDGSLIYTNNDPNSLVSQNQANMTTVVGTALSSLSPTSGTAGTSVTIMGTNLTRATAVSFNGTAATFTVNAATQTTATVPTGASTGNVTVTIPGGTSNDIGFTVAVPASTLSALSPTSGPVGTSVIITGTILTGTMGLAFNGVSATFVVNSATQITISAPDGATTGSVVVTTPGGPGNGVLFTEVPTTPTLSSISPNSSPVSTTVVLTDSNLTETTAVNFNGTGATFTVNPARLRSWCTHRVHQRPRDGGHAGRPEQCHRSKNQTHPNKRPANALTGLFRLNQKPLSAAYYWARRAGAAAGGVVPTPSATGAGAAGAATGVGELNISSASRQPASASRRQMCR